MTGGARVCAGCGVVFAGPLSHDRCGRCHRSRRELRLLEAGYRRGWADAVTRVGASLDREALAAGLAELWRDGGSR